MNADTHPGQQGSAPSPPPPIAPRPASSGAPGGPREPQPSPGKAVAIVAAVVGGIALVGTGIGVGLSSALSLAPHDEVQSADAGGLAALDIDASAADFLLVFDGDEEAVLETIDARGRWTLGRDGDELVVRRENTFFGFGGPWWGGGWFDDWYDGEWSADEETVVLRLPERLRGAGLDLEATLSAGAFEASGDFGELDLEVGAGAVHVEGSARSATVDLSAGRAELSLADVAEADLGVSAGRLDAVLTGRAPEEVDVRVSAGKLDLTLPDEQYDVRSDVSAGSLDNLLKTSSGSPREIRAEVAAGNATLRPAR